jgi:hypothetical protein
MRGSAPSEAFFKVVRVNLKISWMDALSGRAPGWNFPEWIEST